MSDHATILATLPALPDGFACCSGPHDVAVMFLQESSGLILAIAEPDASQREWEGMPRFTLWQCTERHPDAGWQVPDEGAPLFESDDWSEMVDLFDHISDGGTPAEAALGARLRTNRLTVADAQALLAEELAAPRPCPDMIAGMREIIAKANP